LTSYKIPKKTTGACKPLLLKIAGLAYTAALQSVTVILHVASDFLSFSRILIINFAAIVGDRDKMSLKSSLS